VKEHPESDSVSESSSESQSEAESDEESQSATAETSSTVYEHDNSVGTRVGFNAAPRRTRDVGRAAMAARTREALRDRPVGRAAEEREAWDSGLNDQSTRRGMRPSSTATENSERKRRTSRPCERRAIHSAQEIPATRQARWSSGGGGQVAERWRDVGGAEDSALWSASWRARIIEGAWIFVRGRVRNATR
jgi:hypothetical protein